MASRIFTKLPRFSLLASSGTILGVAGVGSTFAAKSSDDGPALTPAEQEFNISSCYSVPLDWSGPIFQIKNDYPNTPASASTAAGNHPLPPGPVTGVPGMKDPTPWLDVDFRKEPEKYCQWIKTYCYEGNVDDEFNGKKNSIRDWYHAPWMHSGPNGREPLNGLTFERPTPKWEFSDTQDRALQTWAKGFYNHAGAILFGQMWRDPNNPEWETNLKFPLGTCVFKILMTDATDHEVPSMKGSPAIQAVISPTPADGTPLKNGSIRNKYATPLRLLQMDFAVRDDRSPIGWVFGTFMYDGDKKDEKPWDRIIPVGIMWGNDPQLTQAEHDPPNSKTPIESWINPRAEALRHRLNGARPSWGWNGRLNGPADNFISSCASCHSLSQRDSNVDMVPPAPTKQADGSYVPVDDKKTMHWFRNIRAGEPFSKGDRSGDYSLQLLQGWRNYHAWKNTQMNAAARIFKKTKYVFGGRSTPEPGIQEMTGGLRFGPEMEYEKGGGSPGT